MVNLSYVLAAVFATATGQDVLPEALPNAGHHNHYAVLVAGSAGYFNYRHQADICHAYSILVNNGIPAENIILFSADDVAHSHQNPFPGKLFNHPSGSTPGRDVYANCKVSYRGSDVTVDHFEAVLTGNASGVPDGHPVLKSTADDLVFVNFVDHGSEGSIGFPTEQLSRERFQNILETMEKKRMYKSTVIYIEACESGSMFDDYDKIPKGMYIVTAANATESSWGTYCPNEGDPEADMVHGAHIGTCLGDLFSVNWMEDADQGKPEGETILDQVEKITRLTTRSHVQQYGDMTVARQRVTDFEGNTDADGWQPIPPKATSALRLVGQPEAATLASVSALVSESFGRPIGVSGSSGAEGPEMRVPSLAEHQRLSRHKEQSSIPQTMIDIQSTYVSLSRAAKLPANQQQELSAAELLLEATQRRVDDLKRRMSKTTTAPVPAEKEVEYE